MNIIQKIEDIQRNKREMVKEIHALLDNDICIDSERLNLVADLVADLKPVQARLEKLQSQGVEIEKAIAILQEAIAEDPLLWGDVRDRLQPAQAIAEGSSLTSIGKGEEVHCDQAPTSEQIFDAECLPQQSEDGAIKDRLAQKFGIDAQDNATDATLCDRIDKLVRDRIATSGSYFDFDDSIDKLGLWGAVEKWLNEFELEELMNQVLGYLLRRKEPVSFAEICEEVKGLGATQIAEALNNLKEEGSVVEISENPWMWSIKSSQDTPVDEPDKSEIADLEGSPIVELNSTLTYQKRGDEIVANLKCFTQRLAKDWAGMLILWGCRAEVRKTGAADIKWEVKIGNITFERLDILNRNHQHPSDVVPAPSTYNKAKKQTPFAPHGTGDATVPEEVNETEQAEVGAPINPDTTPDVPLDLMALNDAELQRLEDDLAGYSPSESQRVAPPSTEDLAPSPYASELFKTLEAGTVVQALPYSDDPGHPYKKNTSRTGVVKYVTEKNGKLYAVVEEMTKGGKTAGPAQYNLEAVEIVSEAKRLEGQLVLGDSDAEEQNQQHFKVNDRAIVTAKLGDRKKDTDLIGKTVILKLCNGNSCTAFVEGDSEEALHFLFYEEIEQAA